MKLYQRMIKLEKILPAELNQEENELEQVCSWLAQHCEEYMECVRQLFRLQYKTVQHSDNQEQCSESCKQHASFYLNRINELIQENKSNVKI